MNSLPKKYHGIVLLDKPLHLSSNQALGRVKRLFGMKKAGHTGSLDPLATGMLPVCLGEATKFSQYLLSADKHYRVTARLGEKTTTGDSEGEIISKRSVPDLSIVELEKVLDEFRGELMQVPSMYSALKHQGKPLYEYARKGITIDRPARPITIFALHLSHFDHDECSFDVHCSKGTYIRTLIEDIGERLGCGAHVTALHRTSVAAFAEEQMVSLEQLQSAAENDGEALANYILPLAQSLPGWPIVALDTSEIFHFKRGQAIRVAAMSSAPAKTKVILVNEIDQQFLGLGEINDIGYIAPIRVVAT